MNDFLKGRPFTLSGGLETKHIFPLVKLDMVIVSAAPDTWWAGYQVGRLNQRDADERGLTKAKPSIAESIYYFDNRGLAYTIPPWETFPAHLQKIYLNKAGRLIKLITGETK